MKKIVMIFFIFIFFLGFASATLGISPANQEIDFISGQKVVLTYKAITDDPNESISLNVSGDFEKYTQLSTYQVTGEHYFTLTINMPDSFDKPGISRLAVIVSEQPQGGASALGTQIRISGTLRIRVPYKGKYASAFLTVANGNVNENIPVKLQVINYGTETTAVNGVLNVYNNENKLLRTLNFEPVVLEPREDKVYNEMFSSEGFVPGDHLAIATVDYGKGKTTVNQTFRVGSLFVNVTNFTTRVQKQGIQKFYVDIENLWNAGIGGVYADVVAVKGQENATFKTNPDDIAPWEKKRLEGFIETTGLSNGVYDTEITLHYSGETTVVHGSVEIYTPVNHTTALLLVGGAALVLLIVIVIYFIRRKKGTEKGKKKK